MSRPRNRRRGRGGSRARPTTEHTPDHTPQASTSWPGGYGGLGNGHQGADYSRLRGQVYFPQLDTRREITSYSRQEILRKARWLYANTGLAKRIVNGLARMVAGTGLTVQASTTDKTWNALAEKAFAQRTTSPFVFDVGGRYDFASSQQAQLRFSYRDGDAAAVLAKSATAAGRMAFYESHQIGNGPAPAAAPGDLGYRDGVRHDPRTNRPTAYRFLGDNNTHTDLSTDHVAFMCDYERAGQSRGLSILAGAIPHMLDAREITSYIKTGVKLANRYGSWTEKAANTGPSSGTAGGRIGGNKTQVTTDNGPISFEQIMGGGIIPDLPPGHTLKFANSAHPHPNNLGLLDYLIRDIAWGCGISPEILWNIAALGGANTRFVLADAQSWIEEQQARLVRTYNSRVWIYFIALEMKAGRLPPCQDPEWWKHGWIPPPRLTVDFGRDGKLQIEQLKMGVITYSRLLGWQSQDFETHTDKWLDELAYIKSGLAKRDMDWGDVQSWRNNFWAPSEEDNDSDPTNDTHTPTDTANALAELAKNPARAQAYLQHLAAQPEREAA